jgi:mevalonate kinase
MKFTAVAPGKIILTGEYAVVFGYPGIAVPAPLAMQATFEELNSKLRAQSSQLRLKWLGISGGEAWEDYARRIVLHLEQNRDPFRGTLTVRNRLPLKKGMGSSTALVIALTRVLLGKNKRAEALAVEDQVNPGHSGIDFAVIWEERPLLFRKGTEPQPVALPHHLLRGALLIDTGTPNETTPELVAWVKERIDDPRVKQALISIGKCTERLRKVEDPERSRRGEDIRSIFHSHHRAQVALGVVPKPVQGLIKEIERLGGAAKVLGAGGRTGGGGTVLALHRNPDLILPMARKHAQGVLPLFTKI